MVCVSTRANIQEMGRNERKHAYTKMRVFIKAVYIMSVWPNVSTFAAVYYMSVC